MLLNDGQWAQSKQASRSPSPSSRYELKNPSTTSPFTLSSLGDSNGPRAEKCRHPSNSIRLLPQTEQGLLLRRGRRSEAGSIARVPAKEVEAIVLDVLRDRPTQEGQGGNAGFREIKLRVRVCSEAIEMTWQEPDGAGHRDDGDCRDDLDRHRIIVPYVVQPHKRKREIILPEISSGYLHPIERKEQQNLISSIAQGRAWLQANLAGKTISAIAQREKRSERMIRMMLSLAFLDPHLVRAALHGTLPRGISTRRLIDAPMAWHDQWREIGLSRPT